MKIFYSPEISGFLHEGLNEITDDAIELSQKEYDGLIEEISLGKVIKVVKGKVKAVEHESTATWDSVRKRRNRLLARCDWTQLSDVDMPKEKQQAWNEYRSALRNITEQGEDPSKVVWPEQP